METIIVDCPIPAISGLISNTCSAFINPDNRIGISRGGASEDGIWEWDKTSGISRINFVLSGSKKGFVELYKNKEASLTFESMKLKGTWHQ